MEACIKRLWSAVPIRLLRNNGAITHNSVGYYMVLIERPAAHPMNANENANNSPRVGNTSVIRILSFVDLSRLL